MLPATFDLSHARSSRTCPAGTGSPSTKRRRRKAGSRAGCRRRGAALVELALMLPFLFFLFLMTADFGRVYHYSVTLQNCARAGAMYACDPHVAHESPFDSTEDAALADASDLDPPPVISQTTGTDENGRIYVEVKAEYTFRSIVQFPGVPVELNLSRTARMYEAAITPDA